MKTRFSQIKRLFWIITLVIGVVFLLTNSKLTYTKKSKEVQINSTINSDLASYNNIKVNSAGLDNFSKKSQMTINSLSLDGTWMVVPDSNNLGMKQEWWKFMSYPNQQAKTILVPGNTYEALPGYNGVAWYMRSFDLDVVPVAGRRSFLNFGAVQYLCRVWLNGQEVGNHEGAESPFKFEVTGKLNPGSNVLILKVENPLGFFRNGAVPVAYDQGGILAHVDLIEQPRLRIADVYAKPDPKSGVIMVEVTCDNAGIPAMVELSASVTERVSRKEKDRAQVRVLAPTGISVQNLPLKVEFPHKWDLDDPFLYSVEVIAAANGDEDLHRIDHLGFRDFRIIDGYFNLNGRRIYLKSTHENHYDPILVQGVSRDMRWLGIDAAKLKAAGFNTFRSLASAFLPEQLAIADEVGLLMYSEHAGSWLLRDSTKFMIELPEIVRRDRHSPSLVMFGLLNEIDNRSPGVYKVARKSLPIIRAIDDTRLIMISSGRWDRDFKTGSASNPGSTTWDVFLGGEGPNPIPTGVLPDLSGGSGGYSDGGGDLHVYHNHPTSWNFINAFRNLAQSTQRVFLSEGGCGSIYDCYTDKRKLIENKAPLNADLWNVANSRIKELEDCWKRYGLSKTYNEIQEMIVESQQAEAKERDLYTRAVRSNPKICGYSLTSLAGGNTGEGIWDKFRDWKAGHQEVVTAGWAPTRFCLLINPVPIISGKPFRLVASFVDEDRLPAGIRHVVLRVRDSQGTERWTKTCSLTLGEPGKRPFASLLLDEELPDLPLTEGSVTVEATLDGYSNLPGDHLEVPAYDAARHPSIKGKIQVIGLNDKTRTLLAENGAKVKEYNPSAETDRLVIVCGSELPAGWSVQSWRHVYEQVARGAHLLVLGPTVLQGKSGPTHFLPVAQHGTYKVGPDWLYHCEVIAKPGIVFEGLPARLLTGEIYGHLLHAVPRITGATPPETAIAIAFNGSGMGSFEDGLVIATWKLGAGWITVCTMDVIAQLGTPVSDRLIINLVRYAQANVIKLKPLPANFTTELDKLGIVE
jgi:hypothetical protein